MLTQRANVCGESCGREEAGYAGWQGSELMTALQVIMAGAAAQHITGAFAGVAVPRLWVGMGVRVV